MSRVVDLLCLANSIKHRGRCVAGIDLNTGDWIRSAASTTHGELHPEHYLLKPGGAPRVLDVIRMPLERPLPLSHQPENWMISPEPWQLLHRPFAEPAHAAVTLASNLRSKPVR